MTTTRQDAWTPDDDLLLAEVTLRHIREGSTQLAAFEEVGEKLARTAAACGFRWNSLIRKKYEAAIQIAKAQRKRNKKSIRNTSASSSIDNQLPSNNNIPTRQDDALQEQFSYDTVIRFLRQQKTDVIEMQKRIKQLECECKQKDEEITRLREENKKMSQQINHVQTDYQMVNDDYKTLIRIIDRARKMALLTDEDLEEKTAFKMDPNGNLERINK
ncbi:RsfA family transcriptional regulator [Microaerobacter geothermalis]|uniref:RsfA family transcriptional regulator n=1 Tax=Microaerobacter geothermalis TaxID=674972 RepID=UPI001F2F75E6|nr:RsfA family transcriptional regulator [Microaerobacter geothermalis]MCF6093569.1 RsfA family transcriptional regulator [Microaerobacter geothermalis]